MCGLVSALGARGFLHWLFVVDFVFVFNLCLYLRIVSPGLSLVYMYVWPCVCVALYVWVLPGGEMFFNTAESRIWNVNSPHLLRCCLVGRLDD